MYFGGQVKENFHSLICPVSSYSEDQQKIVVSSYIFMHMHVVCKIMYCNHKHATLKEYKTCSVLPSSSRDTSASLGEREMLLSHVPIVFPQVFL